MAVERGPEAYSIGLFDPLDLTPHPQSIELAPLEDLSP